MLARLSMFIMLICVAITAHGQNNSAVDSLLVVLESEHIDSNKAKIHFKLFDILRRSELTKAEEHAKTLFRLSSVSGYTRGIGLGYASIGLVHLYRSEPDSAIWNFLKAMDIVEEMGDTERIAVLNIYLGSAYNQTAEYALSISYHERAKRMFEESGNEENIAACHINIGLINELMTEYNQAHGNFLAALEIYDRLNMQYHIALALHNIGLVYSNQTHYQSAIDYYKKSALVFAELGRFRVLASSYLNIGSNFNSLGKNDSAKVYYKKSLLIYTDFDNKEGIADVFHNMGNILVNEDSLEMAEKHLMKAFEIRNEIGDRDGLVKSLSEIGSIHYRKKEYTLALEYVEKSIKLAKEIHNLYEVQRAYKKMAEIYNKLDRNEEAYRYYQLYTHLKDSIFDKEKIQQILDIQTKYETEKKQQENELLLNKTRVQELQLSRRNNLIYGLIGVAALLLVIGLLVIKQNRLRAKQRAVELEQNAMKLEQQLLRSQMNPHFIFNSLNAIQSFLYDHDPEEAGKYLSKFAVLVRLILENSRKEFISLEREIKFLEHYLELQQLRFEKEFDFKIETSSEIDIKTTAIPPMLAQPFIENSLEHGFQHLKTKGQISLDFVLKDNELVFSIEDNGIGRAAAAKLEDPKIGNHESLATKITEERLAILTKRHGQTINMVVSDLKSDSNGVSGTKVTFHIPFRYVGFDKQSA